MKTNRFLLVALFAVFFSIFACSKENIDDNESSSSARSSSDVQQSYSSSEFEQLSSSDMPLSCSSSNIQQSISSGEQLSSSSSEQISGSSGAQQSSSSGVQQSSSSGVQQSISSGAQLSSSSSARQSSSSNEQPSSSSANVLPPTSCTSAKLKSSLSKGTVFTPDMLGLQPGKTISELNFNWYSGNASDQNKSLVRVFKGDCLVAEGTGTQGSIYNSSYRYHKASATNLEPNTQYTYWLSNDGTNWSKEYNYKSPPAGAFKFAALSDVQFNDSIAAAAGSAWKAIAKKAAGADISLIVYAGDHVEHCNNGEVEYIGFYSAEEVQSIPMASVMGNHDLCPNFGNHFNFPNIVQGSATYTAQSNYYFLYNRILFIGLNTAPEATEANVARYIADYEKTIDAAKAAHTQIQYDFIVVTHHKSTTSVSAFGHSLDADVITYVNAGLQRLFTEKGVDLVFTGHDHVYVRSQLMKNDHPSTDGSGTLYLTLKPASVTRNYSDGLPTPGFYAFGDTDPTQYINSYPYVSSYKSGYYTYYLPESHAKNSPYTDSRPGYSIIEVSNARMTINIYEENGTLFEQIELRPTLAK